ncbi:RimK family alpha-L-glutamate ligase [Candidatus Woesebacteria bacterium]|nr:RimK family alpha-L-glutamate ligase [Candidatus Woesebacteria bacterium]QQG47446.1 MAG: RimK family alpha-L-glutamate ligase [Candidatus Woesebacteria bacterium]
MKISLITTLTSLDENKRIEEEIRALGHDFELVDLSEFKFSIIDNKLNVDKLDNLNCDIAIVRGIFTSIKSISNVIVALKERGIKIFDNNVLKHQYSIDKIGDILRLNINHLPIPDSFYSRDFEDYKKASQTLGFPFVFKSSRMGKGASVYKLNNQNELNDLISKLQEEGKEAKSFIAQKFIDYEYDIRALVIGGEIFPMRRIPGQGEFRANFSLGGSVETIELDSESRKLANLAVKAVDMSVAGVDILIDKQNKKYLLEVNHTAGFIGMEKAYSKNIGKVYVEHAIANAK